MNGKLSLVVFSLLAFSLLLFGCLNQGGQQAAASGGGIEPLPTIDSQYTASGYEAGAIANDVSGLDVNESNFTAS